MPIAYLDPGTGSLLAAAAALVVVVAVVAVLVYLFKPR
jgi:hypothetical protein